MISVEEDSQYFDDNGDFHIVHKDKKIIIRKKTYEKMNINQIRDITLPSVMEKYPIDTWVIDETVPDDIAVITTEEGKSDK